MDIFVLDTDFNIVAVIDYYKSFIWTDRYTECGDFELVIPMSDSILSIVRIDYYLKCSLSDRTMIVETIELTTDIEEGTFVTFTGRSLESILERRVVWGYFVYSGSMQTGLKNILEDNIGVNANAYRKLSNFSVSVSSIPDITEIQWDFVLLGDNLYDVIFDCCKSNDVGFKIILNSSNEFIFSLYVGVNRSYLQSINPWVVFSPAFDNLISSKYYRTDISKKTIAMVVGDGENESVRTITFATMQTGSSSETEYKRRWGYSATSSSEADGGSGLNRKEVFVDAKDISKTYTDDQDVEQEYTDVEYESMLVAKGRDVLCEFITTQTFEGDTDYEGQFLYGRDYFIGDILQIENEYGITAPVRVEEVVITIDESGQSVIPSFTSL